jgi:hypothetical protein
MLTRTLSGFAFACLLLSALGLFSTLSHAAPAYDLTPYQAIAKEVLGLVATGNMAGAKKKVGELEAKWDSNNLRDPLPKIDEQMDAVKDAVSSGDAKKATAELNRYLEMLEKSQKTANVMRHATAEG